MSAEKFAEAFSYASGIEYDPDQIEIIKKVGNNEVTLVNACAGSGKTTTIVASLFKLCLVDKVDSNKINAMSYTNEATYNLSRKFDSLCKKLGYHLNVKFNNFHSMCYSIIKKRSSNVKFIDDSYIDDYEKINNRFSEYINSKNIALTTKEYYSLVRAIDILNSSFIFDEENVKSSYIFLELGLSYETFTDLRSMYFNIKKVLGLIPKGDAPMYAFYLLLLYPEIRDEYKKMYDIIFVDEFQDFNILILNVLALISNKLVLVGDMRQQIYGFQGANPAVITELQGLFKDIKQLPLRYSYRCKQNLCDLAERIIEPNEINEIKMQSRNPGECKIYNVEISHSTEGWGSIIGDEKDAMIMCRNNASLIPVMDYLYQVKKDIYCTKATAVYEIPVIKYLHYIVEIALHFNDEETPRRMVAVMPELFENGGSNYTLAERIWKTYKLKRVDMTTGDFSFKSSSSRELINICKEIKERVSTSSYIGLLNLAYQYYLNHLNKRYYRTLKDNKLDYYTSLAYSICRDKSYEEVVKYESEKLSFINACTKLGQGIKCLTMHGAKALEAKTVILLDVDDRAFPNKTIADKYISKNAMVDLSKALFDESNLLYVAVTRAIDRLYVCHYAGTTLSKLYSSPSYNDYTSYRNNKIFKIKYNNFEKCAEVLGVEQSYDYRRLYMGETMSREEYYANIQSQKEKKEAVIVTAKPKQVEDLVKVSKVAPFSLLNNNLVIDDRSLELPDIDEGWEELRKCLSM